MLADAAKQPAKPRSLSASSSIQKLTAAEMHELTSSPESLPIAPAPAPRHPSSDCGSSAPTSADDRPPIRAPTRRHADTSTSTGSNNNNNSNNDNIAAYPHTDPPRQGGRPWQAADFVRQPQSPRTASTPPSSRSHDMTASRSPRRYSLNPSARPNPLGLGLEGVRVSAAAAAAVDTLTTPAPTDAMVPPPPPSPRLNQIPLPPMSIPTHLQLEIAASRPSPLYIYHPHTNDIPYESSAVKFERLKNVLLLPTYLERTLYFGALACLDAWLYTFTILPIRFVMAVGILVKWWGYVIGKETKWLVSYVWRGLGRLRERGRRHKPSRGPDGRTGTTERSRSASTASDFSEFSVDPDGAMPRERFPGRAPSLHLRQNGQARTGNANANGNANNSQGQGHGSNNHGNNNANKPKHRDGIFRHKRTKSMPSGLTAFHKADLLQGAVIICSSMALMTLDASRMYHFIRAQSAIKLYVIYNILEVGDRLLSALGQDILECLFSNETLSRNPSGRSKVLLPLGMFVLALAYNCLHSIALYYQVITLNVAVNSYSNALLTLLLSNQFVEIKSTVFKRFEKDNLFQLTCADIVERFQLWIMLFIIGMRNFVEVGGLSVPGTSSDYIDDEGPSSSFGSSSSPPLHNSSILPHSFTLLPSWLVSGEVLSPFLIVIGSEMLVDTIKHAYVTKFNNIKPNFYSRILDILCKDYYTNAFMTPSLTRRLGLAVIPLSCLFIRASFQTYHMFLSTHLSMPVPPSTQTSLSEESAVPSSPAMIAALNRFDSLIRDSLGRATYGYPYGSPLNSRPWYSWTSDDAIAAVTMITFFFIAFLVLLILKLLLGMVLLKYARSRYARMRHKDGLIAANKAERDTYDAKGGRRVGGFGHVEVGEERQRWIHADETEGLPGSKGPGGKKVGGDERPKPHEEGYNGPFRYEMVAKRIW
ncbi:Eukaryotic membrane protein family [Geosmithia morbida]|uniref:Eukaryotic membrane protein family n=1 Tax=Geosmithia morbida TaxID=1094350 RepID=A0A9P4YS15_9HYPO|nr:Eukaryotic membrane protein family [Geosmithia morbida]KAF4122063.1 Eukaryotic membrane protein family [Geosmithia morbida]